MMTTKIKNKVLATGFIVTRDKHMDHHNFCKVGGESAGLSA